MNIKLRPENELLLPKITQLVNLGKSSSEIAKHLGIGLNKVYHLQQTSFRKLIDEQKEHGFLKSNIAKMELMNKVLFEKIERQRADWSLKRLNEINELRWLISSQDVHRMRVSMPTKDFDFEN